jgi:hypothetical protein
MSREAIETIQYKGHTISFFPDENTDSPGTIQNSTQILDFYVRK